VDACDQPGPAAYLSDGSTGPKVSVIVPAFNVGRFLDATLRSIQSQSESEWECIVVDDGSVDDTWSVACAFAEQDNRFRIFRKSNGGASSARNYGFRQSDSRAPWVTFMDADDVWRPEALTRLLARAEEAGMVGAHGLAEMIDDVGQPLEPGSYAERGRRRLGLRGRRLVVIPLDEPTDFSVLINGNVLFPPGLVLARRAAYAAVGPFDERFNGPEDWDMLIRLSRLGGLAFVDEVILEYRRHSCNLGARPEVAQQAWLVRCANFWSEDNSPGQRLQARRGWRAYQRDVRRTRLGEARTQLRAGARGAGVESLLRAAAATFRGWRGFPLPLTRRTPLRWDESSSDEPRDRRIGVLRGRRTHLPE